MGLPGFCGVRFRLLRDRLRLGEFDPPELVPYSKIPTKVICSPEHRALALKTARESIVLLVNRNHLDLSWSRARSTCWSAVRPRTSEPRVNSRCDEGSPPREPGRRASV
jgi:beta-glucosidase-like glycosyl hydrolase